jgi:hypothetical protein
MLKFYIADIYKHAGEFWGYPLDLLGVNIADPDRDTALRLAAKFSAQYIADLVEGGHPVPTARGLDEVEPSDAEERVLIPVTLPD